MPKTIEVDVWQPTVKQKVAHEALERFVLYGGAVGGGKSAWLVNEALELSYETPGNVGFLSRHELSSLRRTTLMTLQRFLPAEVVAQHHQTESFYRLVNGSMIFYGGLGDDVEAIERLKSMDLGWFAIDQAEETTESHFYMLASRLRLVLPGIRYKGLLTANPAPGWVKNRFVTDAKKDHIFIPALPKDNPYLPEGYEAGLRELYPPELVAQLLEGNWDSLELGNYLFKYGVVRSAVEREVIVPAGAPVHIGVDVARFGDDSSVATVRNGDKVLEIKSWSKTDLMETTGRVANIIQTYNPIRRNIDVIGMGAGVVDRLREQKIRADAINVAEAARENSKYANLRSEMFVQLAKKFDEGTIQIPDDQELQAQLCGIKYKFDSHGRMLIESKEDMKKRGVRSPDKADSLALAFLERTVEPQIRWL